MYQLEGGTMTVLANTLIRNLSKDKELILMMLQDIGEKERVVEYTIKLHEEEGEVLITLLLTDEQIEEDVREAVSTVLPGKMSDDVFVENEYITFKIIA